MNRVHRRILVSSVKTKRDDGPGRSSPPGLAPRPFRLPMLMGNPKGRTLPQSPLPPKRPLFDADRFSAAAASAAANLKLKEKKSDQDFILHVDTFCGSIISFFGR